MVTISSRQNPLLARFRAAIKTAPSGPLLLEGERLIAEALASGLTLDTAAFTAGRAGQTPDLTARLRAAGVHVVGVTDRVMRAISPSHTPSGAVALAARPGATIDDLPRPGPGTLVLVAADVQDPGNLGGLVRVAEAAGVAMVVTTGRAADPFGWKALRGSMGSAFRVPLVRRPALLPTLDALRAGGLAVVATSPHGAVDLYEASLRDPLALVVGGEGAGLSAEVARAADRTIRVPMNAPVESLNVAVCAALVLYEVRRQRLGGPRRRVRRSGS